ncbi:response regulator [Parathalassolituus penaei]|uniref:Response regulator transcription factor n=1 Tax=Parathalassolituus penaei TaxID=2997323 RepID=A0A9X3IU89_9GAMM|nr:response regulator transcription factor [Parathalassolituus penaei]MCY0965918.1 response regulator transcription factor [Parathalassolituus penaei]
MIRILVIDDEPQIRRFLNISLESQGYEIIEADTGRGGIQLSALEQPDLIILDLGLPDMDGQDVLREIREFSETPVIVLSVRNSEREKVLALDNGCNDYVEKPFGVKELLARIRAVLRTRSSNREAPAASWDDGHLRIDFVSRTVSLNGERIRLSPREYELLLEFIQHPGQMLTQQYLLRKFWGSDHLDDSHYLRIYIRQIRNKIGDDPTSPRYIETEAGVGYRFIAE